MTVMDGVRRVLRPLIPERLLETRRHRWVHRKQRHAAYIIREFHKIYYHGVGSYGLPGDHPIHSTFWLGVPALKCPLDCWIYQELIYRTRPEVIIETGVCYGGTTLFLASILDIVGSGSVIAIDVDMSQIRGQAKSHSKVTLVEGSSVSTSIVEHVTRLVAGRRTMVILDSDHNAHHVLTELTLWGELVSRGCYMVCEDTNLDGNPVFSPVPYSPGPRDAVREFLHQSPGKWEVDTTCEKFLMTCNPGGFLLKK